MLEAYDLAGTLDGLALLDQPVGTEKHDTDLAGLEVHAHALDTGCEPFHRVSLSVFASCGAQCREYVLDQLLSLDVVHAVHTCNTVTVLPLVLRSYRVVLILSAYPTERTRPVSARPDSSCTPRIRCSRMEETSVGEALASAA